MGKQLGSWQLGCRLAKKVDTDRLFRVMTVFKYLGVSLCGQPPCKWSRKKHVCVGENTSWTMFTVSQRDGWVCGRLFRTFNFSVHLKLFEIKSVGRNRSSWVCSGTRFFICLLVLCFVLLPQIRTKTQVIICFILFF